MPRSSFSRLRFEALEDRTVPSAVAADRVLVSFADGATTAAHVAQLDRAPVAKSVTALGFGTYRVDLAAGIAVGTAVSYFSGQPGVSAAQADRTITVASVPNDSRYGDQWGMSAISAAKGWNEQTGTGQTIVAVIDTGIDYSHPDLVANLWRNPNASAADRYGYDFVNNDADPMDDNGHGTHVAGTIGATGNNGVGVTGVLWKTQIMALKFMDANGNGYTSDAIRAMDYAVAHGAKVLNNSWGGAGADPLLNQAIARARAAGVVVVVAAGNESANNDTTPSYPASYVSGNDNVVTVAATNESGGLAYFSNYGATTVTIAAPGMDILSTARGGGYGLKSGTSMATPVISGAIALLWDEHPTWTYAQVLNKLKQSVDTSAALNGKVATGQVNLAKLLDATNPPVSPPPVSPPPAVSPPVSPPPAASSPIRWTGAGARITTAVFSGTATGSYDTVRLTFDKRMSASTLTASDIVLTGPNGKIAVASIVAVAGNGNVFDVRFARQTAGGTYSITVGPDVWDVTAQRMDQNGNGVNNEAGDKFTDTATLGTATSPPASPPISPPPASAPTTRKTYSAVGGPVAIADQRTTRVMLTVTDDIKIGDLRLNLDLTHQRTTDLHVRLVAPDGRKITLFNRRNLGLANVTFDDAATRTLDTATLPAGSSVRPEQALSLFNGMSAKGTWTVEIFDLFSGAVGTVNAASLSVAAV